MRVNFGYSLRQIFPSAVLGDILVEAASSSSIATQLMRRVGDELESMGGNLQPGTISLTADQLFEMAGTSAQGTLDSIKSGAGKNYYEDAMYPEGPLGRLAGFKVHVGIHCTLDHWTEKLRELTATVRATEWVGRQTVAIFSVDGSSIAQTIPGVAVEFHTHGEFEYIDFSSFSGLGGEGARAHRAADDVHHVHRNVLPGSAVHGVQARDPGAVFPLRSNWKPHHSSPLQLGFVSRARTRWRGSGGVDSRALGPHPSPSNAAGHHRRRGAWRASGFLLL